MRKRLTSLPVRWIHVAVLWAALLVLAATEATAGSHRGLPDFTQLVRENSPAVVNISTRQEMPGRRGGEEPHGFQQQDEFGGDPFLDFLDRFLGDERGGRPGPGPFGDEGRSLGSGFIVSDDGFVLTNQHVVANADEIIVRLTDGREYEAEMVGADERSDVAVLKIDAADLPIVTIGSADALEVGEWVLAIGSPFGFEHSATAGIVSAKGRSLPQGSYVPYIQTDVAINPGNSGGPLFNLDGEVVGINAQIFSRTGGFMGVSFTIPIELAVDVADQLRKKGYVSRGWLGVMIQDVTRDLAQGFGLDRPTGALVTQVVAGSPAAEAGFRTGDVVLEFDGRQVDSSSSLPPIVGRTEIGRTVEVSVLRDGERITLEVVIAELPEDDRLSGAEEPPAPVEPEEGLLPQLGLRLTPLDPAARDSLHLSEEDGGLVVEDVREGAAAAAGIRPGDVIVNVAREAVTSVERLHEILDAVPSGETVPVLIIRRGNPSFLALKMP